MARDYQSSLTGPQMDQALLDMANHTSERYAKGTAEGRAVAPGTIGYEDNAKYYKDQAAAQVDLAAGQVRLAELQVAAAADQVDLAENAAQRAESAVPVGTDSAVLFTRDQSGELTDAQKATARKNIMAGGTNPNLLDNPFFTVNQRGQSSYAGAGYTVDRWRQGSSSSSTIVDDNGVTINADENYGFRQILPADLVTFITGKTVTYSIMLQDGTIGTTTFTWPNSATALAGRISGIGVLYAGSVLGVAFVHPSELSIRAIKLEPGSVSTLANDAPPDYGTELAKCQRYFTRLKADQGYAPFGVGYIETASTAHVFVPINMRSKPASAVARGTFRLMGSANRTGITISYSPNSSSRLARLEILGGTGWPVGQACALSADNDAGAYIDFSADL